MTTTVNVPTCNYSSYKLSAPYDPDLQMEFNSQINSDFKNRDDSSECSICQKNMLQIGYSSDLYNCSSCLGFSSGTGYSGKYRITSQTWGCDTCATVVAPVSYYETQGSQIASPEQLKQYLNDLTYKNNVDVEWNSLTDCEQGTVTKSLCINQSIPSFSMIVPRPDQGPPNPQASSGLGPGEIAGIVIGVVLFLVIIGYFVWRWWKSTHIQLGEYPNAQLELEDFPHDEKVAYSANPLWRQGRNHRKK